MSGVRTEGTAEKVRQFKAGQLIDIDDFAACDFIVLRDGVAKLESVFADGRRHVLVFLYPHDPIHVVHFKRYSAVSLEALTGVDVQCGLLRDQPPSDADQPHNGRVINAHNFPLVEDAMYRQLLLGRLTSEERLASFLIEIALRSGKSMSGGIFFDLPMKREDIADYLCINADTVSRLMSQFRKEALLGMSAKRAAFISDLNALCAYTPLASVLMDRFGPASANS